MLAKQQNETYKRHRPETTLLYQLVERYYPDFTANLAEQGKYLPKYVEREFEEFLRCGRLEHGFLLSENPWGGTTFTRIKAPSHSDMVKLVHTISQRIAKYLEKVGLVERDIENSFLNLPIDDEDSLLQLQGASVSYRIAMGPQQG